MSKYKVLKDNLKNVVGEEFEKTLPIIADEYEAKIRRQAAEITRLLRENAELKEESKRNYTINIEMAKAEGHSEAWELAKKIAPTAGGLSSSELVEIFNAFLPRDILSENTYPEAAAKVEAWERQKEEIKVGDIYKNIAGSCFVICDVNEEDNNAQVLWSSSLSSRKTLDEITRYYTKTGRHIDIDSLLKQIGEE